MPDSNMFKDLFNQRDTVLYPINRKLSEACNSVVGKFVEFHEAYIGMLPDVLYQVAEVTLDLYCATPKANIVVEHDAISAREHRIERISCSGDDRTKVASQYVLESMSVYTQEEAEAWVAEKAKKLFNDQFGKEPAK